MDEFTLGEIFELNLKKSRLVVLSACETGLIDLTSISDEYIGLPAGFLFAGSSSVVSSLWTVSDLSTSLLMMKFYEIILDKTQDISIPVALKMDQNWLRNLTVEEFDNLLIEYQSEINKILEILSAGKRLIIEKQIELTRKLL
ncbi:MAG: CHAT domain-containing protein [Crocosphaera sp.]